MAQASAERCEDEFKEAVQTILEELDFERARKVFQGKMHYHNGQQHQAAANIADKIEHTRCPDVHRP